MAPLQFPQIGKQRRDFAAGVLIDAMQADKRIENEETGPELVDVVLAKCRGVSVQP